MQDTLEEIKQLRKDTDNDNRLILKTMTRESLSLGDEFAYYRVYVWVARVSCTDGIKCVLQVSIIRSCSDTSHSCD